MLFDDPELTAVFSPCRRYRYVLRRRWAPGPVLAWILLNPSTADEEKNDPTIRRCISFATTWGFSGLVLGNLFALCSTDPAALYEDAEPIGDENNRWLRQIVDEAEGCVVIGWGMHGEFNGRGADVIQRLRDQGATIKALAATKSGQPVHPLYIPGDRPLADWPE